MCKLQRFQKGSSGFAKTGIIWRSFLLIKPAKKNFPQFYQKTTSFNRFKRGYFYIFFGMTGKL